MMGVQRVGWWCVAVAVALAAGCDGTSNGFDEDADSEVDARIDSDGSPDSDVRDDARDVEVDVRPDADADADGGPDGDADDDADDDADADADADGADDGDADADTGPCPAGMVLVPEGPFLMGIDITGSDIDPKHIVTLSAYCIDLTEVTVRAYQACERAGGCPPPRFPVGPDDHPVTQVDWGSAADYCEWAGKRLPTEAQWEKAARGGCEIVAPVECGPEDERDFPWGNDTETCELANIYSCVGGTTPVGSYPAGVSPYGLFDMAGNVAEWVADWYGRRYYETCAAGCTNPTGPTTGTTRIVRGGSWIDEGAGVSTWRRYPLGPTNASQIDGFRCAATPRPE